MHNFWDDNSLLVENGITRLWYFASSADNSHRRLCYAESEDGIHFSRPHIDPDLTGGIEPENAVLRRDGFVSAESDYEGGTLTTRVLKFDPGELELNVSASAGGAVRVEVLDAGGGPVEGFSGDDSPWICGDSVRLPVRWRSGAVARLAGEPLKFRFHLREARLYSFRVNSS